MCPLLWAYLRPHATTAICTINEFYGTSYRNHAEMCDDAVILHLAGTPGRRPWEVINGVHGNVWQYYYDRSPLRHHYLARKVFNFESRRDVSP